jgi:hypothetical protein
MYFSSYFLISANDNGVYKLFLARRDDCLESYCHVIGVCVTPQGKNFNLGYFELLGVGC